jgi:hypothetical protein
MTDQFLIVHSWLLITASKIAKRVRIALYDRFMDSQLDAVVKRHPKDDW